MLECRHGLLLLALTATAAVPPAWPAAPAGANAAARPTPSVEASADPDQAPSPDAAYELGRTLFDQYAPPEVKAQYEFPSREQWDQFAARLQRALQGDSLSELADCEPEARAALAAVRSLPGYEDYAAWLEARLDLAAAAGPAAREPPPAPPSAAPAPGPPSFHRALPYYDLWLQRLRDRPPPAGAAGLMPGLRSAFVAEGVPPDLAWMAEVESALNPNARSPAGARGLFQLMPDTARAAGLSTRLPDERTDPIKSARAAAGLLRRLHTEFASWALALAAYNAGEGRVSRTLAARRATTFAEIASALPAETRLYVPKVYATIAVRTGAAPEGLAAQDH